MVTVVRFEAAGSAYCLPVEATRAVRPSEALVPLPAPRADVVGVLPGEPPLTVLAPLGGAGGQVLVLESAGRTFGLLVDSVNGLRRVHDADIRSAPGGQERPLVCGTVSDGDQLLLMTDAGALARRL